MNGLKHEFGSRSEARSTERGLPQPGWENWAKGVLEDIQNAPEEIPGWVEDWASAVGSPAAESAASAVASGVSDVGNNIKNFFDSW